MMAHRHYPGDDRPTLYDLTPIDYERMPTDDFQLPRVRPPADRRRRWHIGVMCVALGILGAMLVFLLSRPERVVGPAISVPPPPPLPLWSTSVTVVTTTARPSGLLRTAPRSPTVLPRTTMVPRPTLVIPPPLTTLVTVPPPPPPPPSPSSSSGALL